ncbi:MAG: YdeI/OmpD-associated family protein [Bacteroidota bacterium]
MKEFISSIEQADSTLGWHFTIPVIKDIAADFMENDRRVICSINGAKGFHAALMSDGKGDFFINLNKERRKRLGVAIGEPINITLSKDESKYGMPMPEEFEELLAIDDEGNHFFHALTPGKQRSLLHLIGKPKSSDVRLKKAIVINEHLKKNQGKLDFKQLNQDFKDYNQQFK